jgi:hypothetical protein
MATNQKKTDTPNHDAAANNAAVAGVQADAAMARLPRASRRLRDIADAIRVEYIRPVELSKLGPFNLVDAHIRQARGEFGIQCDYECIILTGDAAGASSMLTLNESPTRRKLVEQIQKYGSVGPVLLRPVGKEIRGNQPWGFVEPGTPEAEGVVDPAQAVG